MPLTEKRTPDDNFDQNKNQAPPKTEDDTKKKKKSRIAKYALVVENTVKQAIDENLDRGKHREWKERGILVQVRHVFSRNFRVNVYITDRNLVKAKKMLASFFVSVPKNEEIISNPPLEEVFTNNFSLERYNQSVKNTCKRSVFA